MLSKGERYILLKYPIYINEPKYIYKVYSSNPLVSCQIVKSFTIIKTPTGLPSNCPQKNVISPFFFCWEHDRVIRGQIPLLENQIKHLFPFDLEGYLGIVQIQILSFFQYVLPQTWKRSSTKTHVFQSINYNTKDKSKTVFVAKK